MITLARVSSCTVGVVDWVCCIECDSLGVRFNSAVKFLGRHERVSFLLESLCLCFIFYCGDLAGRRSSVVS